MFPRIAIHTGNSVVITNKHPEWAGTIVIQHNETTSTMLKYGPNMTAKAKLRHPPLSTWQSDCCGRHWAPFTTNPNWCFSPDYATADDDHSTLMFDQEVKDGKIVVPVVDTGIAVAEPIAH